MNKLLSATSAIAIAIVISSAAQAGVALTDENLDTVTAGLLLVHDSGTTSYSIGLNFDPNVPTDVSIAIPGTTLAGQCTGNNCAVSVNGGKVFTVCSTCTVAIGQSGITMTDASGKCLATSAIAGSSAIASATALATLR